MAPSKLHSGFALLGTQKPAQEDDEDDYMSMTIAEPAPSQSYNETSTQRRARKKREAETRAHPPSKAELARLAELNRDETLKRSLPTTSKGFQMMQKLGFKQGQALGKEGNQDAKIEPLELVVKEGREGVGMEGERKRKFRKVVGEDGDEAMAKKRETEGEYQERQGRELEEKRLEGLFWGAMKVLEGFEGEEQMMKANGASESEHGGKLHVEEDRSTTKAKKATAKPTRSVNVLWRGLVRQRQEQERERRARYDLLQRLSRNTAYNDPDEDQQDRQAWSGEEVEVEEEDPELDEFLALEPAQRLSRLVIYLRQNWRYCFWCKFQYPDEEMEDCPGLGEDEHG